MADDAPPVPRVPSRYRKDDNQEGDASSRVIRTYVPPRLSGNSAHRALCDIVDTIPQDFHQLEATRASQLICRTYIPSHKTRLPEIERKSEVEQASTSSASSVSHEHQDQAPSSLRRPGRRPSTTPRELGDDIPILVPDGYVSDPWDIDPSSRTTYRSSRTSHRLRELPKAGQQPPHRDETTPVCLTTRGPRTPALSTKRSQNHLDVRFSFDDNEPSDLWRAVQALRLDQDDQDYRQRLVDRPTMYEDSRVYE